MENKLPSNESNVWTLSDFIERRKDWEQKDEARLAKYLQQLSNKITLNAKNTLNELDDLIASIDDTAVQIANINNEFQLLADKQFIENKVQEEDETVKIKDEKPVARETNNADILVNNLKEALKNSFNAIDSHFEKVTVVVSDSDDDDDELKHEEVVLRPKTFYKKLNLPSLSGNIQSEIAFDSAMSSDSDSIVEHPTNTFKDEESLFSNDVPEEDNHSVIESNIIYEPSPHLKPKTVPTFADNDNDDLFSPPPLPNDYEDDLENDCNIFDNRSNMYSERTLWDDDDDDDDISNEPPLPIHSDEPPQQIINSNNTQENAEVPSIQQSLNAELQKRFQKDDNIFSTPNNIYAEPSKMKLPKGAVNILGGTNIKPYAANPDQNTKQATISQMSNNVAETENNFEDVKNSNKLFEKSSKSLITSLSKDPRKETQSLEKRSLFQQDSDDEDLFVEKKSIVISASKPNIPKQNENSPINIKSSKTIFSDSDSDDELINSKSTSKTVTSHTIVDNNSITFLDSSSEDDLFNVKSVNNKSILKQKSTLFSSSVFDEVFNKSKQINSIINHKPESPIQEKNAKQIVSTNICDKSMKNNSKESNFLADNTIRKESVPNNNVLNRTTTEPPLMNNTIKSSNLQHKKLSNLFSSDDDDFDDVFLNVNKFNNENRIEKDQTIYDSAKLIHNSNNELNESKLKMFDFSSDDDDIFNTNKSNNNFISSKNNKLLDSEETKTIGSKLNDDCAIINQLQNTENLDKINSTEKNIVDKKNINICSFLSDGEDEDDNYLSFNSNSDRSMNISSTQNLEENSKTMSLSSEEFLSPRTDLKNDNIFYNSSSENFLDKQNQKLINEEEINTPINETLTVFKSASVENNKLPILSNSDNEQLVSFNSNIYNENTESAFKEMYSASNSSSNSSFKNVLDNKNQEISNEKNIDTTNNDTLFTSIQKLSTYNHSFVFSSSDDEEQVLSESQIHSKIIKNETNEIGSTSNSSFKNVFDNKNLDIFNEKNTNVIKNETFIPTVYTRQTNQSSIFSNSDDDDDQQLPFESDNNNKDTKNKIKLINSSSESKPDSKKLFFKDSVDSFSFTQNSKDEPTKKLPGKLSKNAGDFINIVGLLPNSKKPLNIQAIPKSASLDEKSDENLPTSGTKLFSAGKERAKIQVKRRPQSRKARIAAARKSSIDTGYKSSLQESRLFGSTSDLVDYQSSTILNATDVSNEFQSKIQEPFNNKLVLTYDNKVYEGSVKTETNNKVKKQTVLDLFVDNSSKKETNSTYVHEDNKEKIFDNKPSDSNLLHKEYLANKLTHKQIKVIEASQIVNESIPTQSTILFGKSNSLFDDDDDLFSLKSEKVKKISTNLFDSDDEFDFDQKFTKKASLRTNSIFGDDSDDDLFSSTTISSVKNLPLQKPIDKLSQLQNRSTTDGYVKLTAESVAINPLESKKT